MNCLFHSYQQYHGFPPYSTSSCGSFLYQNKGLRRHAYLYQFYNCYLHFCLCYFCSTLDTLCHFAYSDPFFILFSSLYPSHTTTVLNKVKMHVWVRVMLSKSHWSVGFEIRQRLLIFCLTKEENSIFLKYNKVYPIFPTDFFSPRFSFA